MHTEWRGATYFKLRPGNGNFGGFCFEVFLSFAHSLLFFFFTLVTGPRRSLSLKLSDTKVYGMHATVVPRPLNASSSPVRTFPSQRPRERRGGGYLHLGTSFARTGRLMLLPAVCDSWCSQRTSWNYWSRLASPCTTPLSFH